MHVGNQWRSSQGSAFEVVLTDSEESWIASGKTPVPALLAVPRLVAGGRKPEAAAGTNSALDMLVDQSS
jgi:hypothetical protein